MNYRKLILKNARVLFRYIIKFEDFDLYALSIDEKCYENVLVYNNHTKIYLVQNHCVLGSVKHMDSLELMMELDI